MNSFRYLADVFVELPIAVQPVIDKRIKITGIAIDSRQVKEGDLFIALLGGTKDGHEFIDDAINKGAVAVIGEKTQINRRVPYFRIENTRYALTWIAASYYGFPGRKLTIIGVTGTDGKTTTCNLLFNILQTASIKTGLISTVSAVIGSENMDTGFHVTTPDAHEVQRLLALMVERGITHAILETTSHGWAQHRVDACEFDIGVLTNITHEHLDEHKTYANYLAAKARLFQSLENTLDKPQGNPRLSVLNMDDQSFEALNSIIHTPKIRYSQKEPADYHASSISTSDQGIEFQIHGPGFSKPINCPLAGEYNVSNCLAALAASIQGLGIDPSIAINGISTVPAIPGRMERIDLGQPFMTYVDFAHTPNALKSAIKSTKRTSGKKVIVVFGSAGLRDREKRRMMAEIGTSLADKMILTAEDPRTEPLESILEEMASSAVEKGGVEGSTFWRIKDRGDAIRKAVSMAKPGDVVIVCGKGHEKSMCFGTTEYPWDDRIALRAAIREMQGLEGPSMPFLPTSTRES